MEPSQRLATAPLYGIKTDTLFSSAAVISLTLSAFNYLYPIANKTIIARSNWPALPREDGSDGPGIDHLQVDSSVAVIHLAKSIAKT